MCRKRVWDFRYWGYYVLLWGLMPVLDLSPRKLLFEGETMGKITGGRGLLVGWWQEL
jgi:hypothetical protein